MPASCQGSRLPQPKPVRLLDTTTTIDKYVYLNDIVMTEFSPTKHIRTPFKCHVARTNQTSSFDIIFGMDYLVPMGIDILCSKQCIQWMNEEIPFKDPPIASSHFKLVQQQFLTGLLSSQEIDDDCHMTSTPIKHSTYAKADIKEVVDKQ